MTRLCSPRAQFPFNYPLLAHAGCAAAWSEATRAFPTRARSSRGTSNVRQGATPEPPATLDCSPASNRAKRSAARRGSQSAYKARPRRPIAFAPLKFSRPRRHLKHATLKAVFADEPPATWHAAREVRFTRNLRRDSQRRDRAGVVYHREAANFLSCAPI